MKSYDQFSSRKNSIAASLACSWYRSAQLFPERVAHVLALDEVAIKLEAEGIVETVGIDPISGLKRWGLTAKGRERAELEAQAEDATKH